MFIMEEKKKTTLFIGGLGGGGAERVVCNLANYLLDQDWDVRILTMSDKKSAYFMNPDIKLYPLIKQSERKNIIYNSALRYLRLKKYVKTELMDCYIVMLPVTILLTLVLRKKIKAKVIISERSTPVKYPIVIRALLKILVHRADGVVFQTKEVYEWYKPYIKKSKAVIIPNAVNMEFLTNDENIIKENRIIAAGRLIEVKNFSLLIKAYSRIVKKYSDYKVIIFGDGPERNKLINLANELGVEKNVVVVPYTNNLEKELKKSKLFVLSSNYEGMPNVLIEAMASGLPCIATDCIGGGPKSLIHENENGFLVEVGNDEQMAYYMDLVLSSEKLANNIGNQARKITETLHPGRIYSMWESFVEDVAYK